METISNECFTALVNPMFGPAALLMADPSDDPMHADLLTASYRDIIARLEAAGVAFFDGDEALARFFPMTEDDQEVQWLCVRQPITSAPSPEEITEAIAEIERAFRILPDQRPPGD